MTTKRQSYHAVGFFDYLWQIVKHEQKLNEICSKKLKLKLINNETLNNHLDNISKSDLIDRLDSVWQNYFGIGKGYSSSIYWSEYARNKFDFYKRAGNTINKDNFRREHVVPKNVHVNIIYGINNKYDFIRYMLNNYIVCVVTNEQDDDLNNYSITNNLKLDKNMPLDWNWEDGPWTRYETVGITWDLNAPRELTPTEILNRFNYLSTVSSLTVQFNSQGFLD